MKRSRVFIRRRPVFLAWHPLRGRRCDFGFCETRDDRRYFHIAAGPLYLGLGYGVPLP